MCKDCDLSEFNGLFRPGFEPPKPDKPKPSVRPSNVADSEWRFYKYQTWWNRLLENETKKSQKCIVCRVLKEPSGSSETGGSCCGICGESLRASHKRKAGQEESSLEQSTLDQRQRICSHFPQFILEVPFVCDDCWKMLFPCKAESYKDRVELITEFLKTKHGLTFSELTEDLHVDFLTSGDSQILLEDVQRCLDYDHAIRTFTLYGGKHVTSCGTQRFCPLIENAEQAADLIAQRVFLRKKDNVFHNVSLQMLEDPLYEYADEMDESRYDSGSDPDDVAYHESVRVKVGLKIQRHIVNAEHKTLQHAGGKLPETWPWMADSKVVQVNDRNFIVAEYEVPNFDREHDQDVKVTEE